MKQSKKAKAYQVKKHVKKVLTDLVRNGKDEAVNLDTITVAKYVIDISVMSHELVLTINKLLSSAVETSLEDMMDYLTAYQKHFPTVRAFRIMVPITDKASWRQGLTYKEESQSKFL